MRANVNTFIPFINANPPAVGGIGLHRYDGMPHAFVQLQVSEAEEAIATACRFVRDVTA